MNKIDLKKAKERINLKNYSFFEYSNYLSSIDNRTLIIETNDKEFGVVSIVIRKDSFPHLVGMHYCYDAKIGKNKYIGEEGFAKLKNGEVNINKLRTDFRDNKRNKRIKGYLDWELNVLARFEWLPYFFNEMENKGKFFLFRNKGIKTNIKGEHLLMKIMGDKVLVLSIKNNKFLESFIYENTNKFYNSKEEIEIISIQLI